jgi:uncharacterized membrane protein YphA (DoxX/SURF4 family)
MALGLLGALGPIAVGASMVTATVVVHWLRGPLAANGGYELTLTNLAGAVPVGVGGVGRYSLDHLFGSHYRPGSQWRSPCSPWSALSSQS